jgi:hypothetical protein
MAEKIVIEAEVKSNIGDVSKDAKSAASEFKVMGISLNGVKAGFASAAVTAKGMFGSIKAGIISTGIGALIVAFGVLMNWFTKTKVGAEALEKIFAGIGAVVNVIVDRISKVAVAFGKLFSGDIMGGLKGVKGAFSGIGEEISNDINLAVKLKGRLQELTDAERNFTIIKAKTRQEIQKARLEALDDSKTAEERLSALQRANDLELKTTKQAIELQKEKVAVQEETMDLSENMAEDLDKLAQEEVALIDLQTQSFQTQKRLATEMETLTNEIRTAEKQALKDVEDKEKEASKQREDRHKIRMKQIADESKALLDAAEKAEKERKDAEVLRAEGWEKRAKREMAIAKAVEDYKLATISKGLGAAAALAGENVALSKGVAAAQTIFQTQQGIMAAMGATSVGDKLLPFPLRLANAISVGVMGATALSTIMSTSPTGGGNNTTPSAGGGGTPAPQMMSGAFDISGGVAPEASKAYVVTDEMSNSQNQLANIRRRATI